MKLFADLYLDEDVSILVATLLVAQGFDAITARDAGMLERDDREQLSFATGQARCMVSHNRVHYERLHTEYLTAGRRHMGIIIAGRHSPYKIACRLAALLNTLTRDEITEQLLYV